MNCPTKEQIQEAAKTSAEAHKAIKKLFPEVFQKPVQPGEIYNWGSSLNEQGSGMIVWSGPGYSFINFGTGEVYLQHVGIQTTKDDLNDMLQRLPGSKLHDCYYGEISGPYRLTSWTTKPRIKM